MRKRIALNIQLDTDFGRNKLRGITNYLRRGVDWEVCMSEGNPFLTLDEIHKVRPDGIIGEFHNVKLTARAERLGIPCVNTSAAVPGSTLPTLCVDATSIGEMAAQHFLEQGRGGISTEDATCPKCVGEDS